MTSSRPTFEFKIGVFQYEIYTEINKILLSTSTHKIYIKQRNY